MTNDARENDFYQLLKKENSVFVHVGKLEGFAIQSRSWLKQSIQVAVVS